MIVTLKSGSTILTNKAFYKTEQQCNNAVSVALDGTVYYQTANAVERVIVAGACDSAGKTNMETAHRNGAIVSVFNGSTQILSGYVEELTFGDRGIGGFMEFSMSLVGVSA